MAEGEFVRHVGVAYGAFLQQTGISLLHQGDKSGMGSAMLRILESKGLGPMGLSGVDVKDELQWFDNVLWNRGDGTVFPSKADELKREFGEGGEALSALMARFPDAEPKRGFFGRMFGTKPPSRERLYCFGAFWLARNGILPPDERREG